MPLDARQFFYNVWLPVSSGRGVGMAGPLPLSHSEILAYCTLTRRMLEPWELALIRRLDLAFLVFQANKAPK